MKVFTVQHDFYFKVVEVDVEDGTSREVCQCSHDRQGEQDARRIANLLMTNGDSA